MANDIADLKDDLIAHRATDLAFVLGNGINRYAMGNNDWGWEQILRDAWTHITGNNVTDIKGMSLTEMYNLLELQADLTKAGQIKEAIIAPFKNGVPTVLHGQLQQYFERWDVPVLTTNFDHMLEAGYERRTLKHPNIVGRYHAKSTYYPWDRYFSNHEITNPVHEYAVWHINGFVDFPLSIKLSSSEYIAQASHSRKFIHKHSMDDFDKKNINYWVGYNTWLHIFFNCSLCVVGLSLNEDETFLRWLLIERQKYFAKFPYRVHKGWYVYKEDSSKLMPEGKRLYLDGVGLKPIVAVEYSDIYENLLVM